MSAFSNTTHRLAPCVENAMPAAGRRGCAYLWEPDPGRGGRRC